MVKKTKRAEKADTGTTTSFEKELSQIMLCRQKAVIEVLLIGVMEVLDTYKRNKELNTALKRELTVRHIDMLIVDAMILMTPASLPNVQETNMRDEVENQELELEQFMAGRLDDVIAGLADNEDRELAETVTKHLMDARSAVVKR